MVHNHTPIKQCARSTTMNESSQEQHQQHRMLLLILLASLLSTGASAVTSTTTPGGSTQAFPPQPASSVLERLTALENRITSRDEELARMLQLLLANQKEILRLLVQVPKGSAATDGTQELIDGWSKLCPRGLVTASGLPEGGPAGASNTVGAAAIAAAFQDGRSSTDRPPRSCREIPDGMSGEETIYPGAGVAGPGDPLEVYCDQDFEDGGWIVFQNRFDGFVNFNRSWEKYRDGFGDIGTEYWLGLDEVHRLTVAVPHEIAFVAESFRGERRWARYSLFEIGGETDRYRLAKLGVYSGTLGDEFTYNKGMEFSTFDQDHDQYANVNCALRTAAGWWHRSCTRINLNGMYGNESGVRFAYWLDWLHLQGLKRTRIMIREVKKRRK